MPINRSVILLLCVVVVFLSSCGNRKDKSFEVQIPEEAISIDVKTNDINRITGAHDVIVCESFIPLSDEIFLNTIVRAEIANGLIFILDRKPQIVCFDMKGKVVYAINKKGPGPKEYANIVDFTLDKNQNRLITYDSGKRRLSFYDMTTGKYLSDTPIQHLAPQRIAFSDGFFFHTPDHYNYPNQKEKHYSLFYSKEGEEPNVFYFPHDAAAEYSFGMGGCHPFFKSNDLLLYNKAFDNKLYVLQSDSIFMIADISLPDFLPFQKIKDKMDPSEIVRSNYSSSLSDFYIIDNILHFTFLKEGYYQTAFYDMENKRMLFCGTRVSDVPTKDLPLYSIICGVSRKQFFSFVYPEQILRRMESHPDLMPRQIRNVSEEDNPVLVFYKIREKEVI